MGRVTDDGVVPRDGARPVLFVQGGGAGTHDEWDHELVASLQASLGPGFEVRYPRMPDEDDPSYPTWSAAIREELAQLGDGPVVVGHSVGGTILVQTLVENPPERPPAAIALVAAPFVGAGGWPGQGFEFSGDLGARLPRSVPVHVFHGADDDAVPAGHAELFAAAIRSAHLHVLPGRDHQLSGDLREVAAAIRDEVTTAAGS